MTGPGETKEKTDDRLLIELNHARPARSTYSAHRHFIGTDHLRVIDTLTPPQAGAGPGICGWLWFGSTQPQGLEIRVKSQVTFAVLATRPQRRPPTWNYPVAEILFIRVTSKCLDSENIRVTPGKI
jgi:hypothetical protein